MSKIVYRIQQGRIEAEKPQSRDLVNMEGADLLFNFAPEEAAWNRRGNDLAIDFKSGDDLVIQDFFTDGNQWLPSLHFSTGATFSCGDFLTRHGIDFETSSGPSENTSDSGGVGEYTDGSGDLVNGVNRLGTLGTDYWSRITTPDEAWRGAPGPAGGAPGLVPDFPYLMRGVLYMHEGDILGSKLTLPFLWPGTGGVGPLDASQIGAVTIDGAPAGAGTGTHNVNLTLPEGWSAGWFNIAFDPATGRIEITLTADGLLQLGSLGGDNLLEYLGVAVTGPGGKTYTYDAQVVVTPDSEFNSGAQNKDWSDGHGPSGSDVHSEYHSGQGPDEKDYRIVASSGNDEITLNQTMQNGFIYASRQVNGTLTGARDYNVINLANGAIAGLGEANLVNSSDGIINIGYSDAPWGSVQATGGANTIQGGKGVVSLNALGSSSASGAYADNNGVNDIQGREINIAASATAGSGHAAQAAYDGINRITGDVITLEARGMGTSIGVEAVFGGSNTIHGNTSVSVDAKSSASNWSLAVSAKGTAENTITSGGNISLSAKNDNTYARGMYAESGSAGETALNRVTAGGNLTLAAQGKSWIYGVDFDARDKGRAENHLTSTGGSVKVVATGNGNKSLAALNAIGNGINAITAHEDIEFVAESDSGTAAGIYAENFRADGTIAANRLVAETGDIKMSVADRSGISTGKAIGIHANYSQSMVELKAAGDITLKVTALDAAGINGGAAKGISGQTKVVLDADGNTVKGTVMRAGEDISIESEGRTADGVYLSALVEAGRKIDVNVRSTSEAAYGTRSTGGSDALLKAQNVKVNVVSKSGEVRGMFSKDGGHARLEAADTATLSASQTDRGQQAVTGMYGLGGQGANRTDAFALNEVHAGNEARISALNGSVATGMFAKTDAGGNTGGGYNNSVVSSGSVSIHAEGSTSSTGMQAESNGKNYVRAQGNVSALAGNVLHNSNPAAASASAFAQYATNGLNEVYAGKAVIFTANSARQSVAMYAGSSGVNKVEAEDVILKAEAVELGGTPGSGSESVAHGMYAEGGRNEVIFRNSMTVTASGADSSVGMYAHSSGSHNVTTGDPGSTLTINSTGAAQALGILAGSHGKNTVSAGELNGAAEVAAGDAVFIVSRQNGLNSITVDSGAWKAEGTSAHTVISEGMNNIDFTSLLVMSSTATSGEASGLTTEAGGYLSMNGNGTGWIDLAVVSEGNKAWGLNTATEVGAPQQSVSIIENVSGLSIDVYGETGAYGISTQDGHNTIEGVETGLTVYITVEAGSSADAFAMYADGGVNEIIGNSGQNAQDYIKLHGDFFVANGGVNSVTTGAGNDMILLHGEMHQDSALSLDAGGGYDTLILRATDSQTFEDLYGDWLKANFGGMNVENIHVEAVSPQDLSDIQDYFSNNSGIFGGTSLSFSHGDTMYLDLFGADNGHGAVDLSGVFSFGDILDTLDDSAGINHLNLMGGKNNTFKLASLDELLNGRSDISAINGMKISGDAGDSIEIGQGWTAGATVGGYTEYIAEHGDDTYSVWVQQGIISNLGG